jgi:hypothetical protein
MWVWIPRYAYQIATNYHLNATGTVNIKFLKDDTTVATDDSTVATSPTYSGSTQTNYIVHPAFTFGGSDFNLTRTSQLSLNLGGDLSVTNQPTTPSGGGTQGGMWKSMYGTSPARFPAYFPSWVLKEIPDPDYPDASGDRFSDNCEVLVRLKSTLAL